MPCRDGGPLLTEQISELRTRLDDRTRWLCAILDNWGLDKLIIDTKLNLVDRERLKEWWEEHQRYDAKQKALHEEAKRVARLRESALDKLTPEEMAALGLT